ncbi:MAG: hypothetical protein ACE5I5_17135 [Candidatus Heimdallarchaeota archaeon]
MKRESILLISLWALAIGFSFSGYESLTGFLFMLVINASFLIPFFRSTFTLEPTDRNRILDLLVIGVALYWIGWSPWYCPICPWYNPDTSPERLLVYSGTIIFGYALLILLYKKYKEGVAEDCSVKSL